MNQQSILFYGSKAFNFAKFTLLSFILLSARASYALDLSFSDEYSVKFEEDIIGLSLQEVDYRGFPITIIKDIKSESVRKLHPEVTIGSIIVSVEDDAVDGLPISIILSKIKSCGRPITIKFRDPNKYIKCLLNNIFILIITLLAICYIPTVGTSSY